MTDKSLVERLRHVGYLNSDNGDWGPRNPDGSEAANLIESQQAEIERLSSALRRHSRHDGKCRAYVRSNLSDCTCGLTAALNEGATPSDPSERNA